MKYIFLTRNVRKLAHAVRLACRFGIPNFIRSLCFNFRYLPFKVALHLPVLISGRLVVENLKKGQIKIEEIRCGVLEIGSCGYPWAPKQTSFLNCKGTITIKGKGQHRFSQGTIINISQGAVLEIGNNFTCAPNLRLTVSKKIVIGEENMWSYENIVLDSDVHTITDMNGSKLNSKGEIVFGDRIWMGARCTVLKNVTVANDVIIGSSTVVTKSLSEPYSIYIGSPARKIKGDIKWKRDWV